MNKHKLLLLTFCLGPSLFAADMVKTKAGQLEGNPPSSSQVRTFKGVPYAQPPVGDLRWKAPQPLKSWTGVREAKAFGPRCMQPSIFGDMNFRSNGMGEDCLYLNIWAPAKANGKLPVLVYYYGGGFIAGDGSEPRYDGEAISSKGVIAVTVNYRLGVFGFLAHPELTAEAPYHASGNYGLLDQAAALRWVHENISAFGGDPNKITIAGESAGSISVSALMASPISRGLIAGAIGESGSIMGTLGATTLAKAEPNGIAFAKSLGVESLAALRALPAEKIEEKNTGTGRFSAVIDGYFLPQQVEAIYSEGKQAHVPLLVGWNSQEMAGQSLIGRNAPTVENYRKALEQRYKDHADEMLKYYPATADDQVMKSATALASDNFIGFSTWRWFNLATKTGGKPVYRYFYERPRPAMRPEMGNATAGLAGGVIRNNDGRPATPAPAATGAVHSAEIEYALGNLDSNKVYAWTPEDYAVSKLMLQYFADFVKTGNPNGPGLPEWPAAKAGAPVQVMHIGMTSGVVSKAEPDQTADRYLFLDQLAHAQTGSN